MALRSKKIRAIHRNSGTLTFSENPSKQIKEKVLRFHGTAAQKPCPRKAPWSLLIKEISYGAKKQMLVNPISREVNQ